MSIESSSLLDNPYLKALQESARRLAQEAAAHPEDPAFATDARALLDEYDRLVDAAEEEDKENETTR